MDVAEDSRWQQEQQQQEQQQEGEDHKKEVDRNESVRARLLTLSQVAPGGEVVPSSDTLTDINEGKSPPPQRPPPQNPQEEEFRRKLVSISYVDVPMSAQ